MHWRYYLPGTSAVQRRDSRAMPSRVEAALRDIRTQAPDLLVISGDLLDYPMEALDDPEMQALGEQDLRMMRGLLDQAGGPYVVIYGNHDHPGLVRQVFGGQPCDEVCAGYRLICFCDAEDSEHVPHRLGGEQQRFWAALSDATSPPQVHVQHYLVWPVRNEGYPHTYAGAEELHEAIVGSGLVRLVLSGHYHRGIPPFREGDTYFATVPAFAEAPYPYWLYDFDEHHFTWQERRMAGPGLS